MLRRRKRTWYQNMHQKSTRLQPDDDGDAAAEVPVPALGIAVPTASTYKMTPSVSSNNSDHDGDGDSGFGDVLPHDDSDDIAVVCLLVHAYLTTSHLCISIG